MRREPVVPAAERWATNADLLYDVWRLGYVPGDVLDTTPGVADGLWFKLVRLVKRDGNIVENQAGDFRRLPVEDGSYDTVAFDPPYKLNGNPDSMAEMSARYGVDVPTRWQDRHRLMVEGLYECARVCVDGGYVLAKCQNQVCSGRMRWQVKMMTDAGEKVGLEWVDEFLMLGHTIPQPMEGRTQKHAHGRPSSLLVFRKRKPRRRRATNG